jgi:hypothetical protein
MGFGRITVEIPILVNGEMTFHMAREHLCLLVKDPIRVYILGNLEMEIIAKERSYTLTG